MEAAALSSTSAWAIKSSNQLAAAINQCICPSFLKRDKSLKLSVQRIVQCSRRTKYSPLNSSIEEPSLSPQDVQVTGNDDVGLSEDVLPAKPSRSASYMFWNSTTEQLAASATFAFLLLQLPQIILNSQNLMAANKKALFALPWIGILTGLLGNLSLLSYFADKKEKGAMLVQAVGVLSNYIVLVQLAIAGSMPTSAFTATSIAVTLGYIVNFLNYKSLLAVNLWKLWQDTISIGGVSVLPQVMWSTFYPLLPPTIIPGLVAFVGCFILILQQRRGKLPERMHKFVEGLAAWSATLLFMWGPIAQMWTNISNPANLRGLSVFTVLLAMIGNGLLLPRALFTRDLMWFTGSSWGALIQGWGVLLSMYIFNCVSGFAFFGISCATGISLGYILAMDSAANSLDSPMMPLAELIKGH